MLKFLKKGGKALIQFVFVTMIMVIALKVVAFAGNLPSVDPKLFSGSQLPTPPENKTGQEIVKSMVLSILQYTKVIVAVLGVLMITVIAYKMIIQGENEEEVGKSKKALTYAIIAFIMISMAEDIGKVFDMEKGTILENPQEILKRVRLFDRQVEIIITFIKFVIGAFATLMLVRYGLTMIAGGGNEEKQGEAKRGIIYTIAALLLLYVGQIFIDRVFYKVNKNVYSGISGVQPGLDAQEGVKQLIGITNLIVTFVGPIAVLMLLVGAIMYITSAGEDERMDRAKRLLTSAAIGIVLIFGAFAIVSTVISGQLSKVEASEDTAQTEEVQSPPPDIAK